MSCLYFTMLVTEGPQLHSHDAVPTVVMNVIVVNDEVVAVVVGVETIAHVVVHMVVTPNAFIMSI